MGMLWRHAASRQDGTCWWRHSLFLTFGIAEEDFKCNVVQIQCRSNHSVVQIQYRLSTGDSPLLTLATDSNAFIRQQKIADPPVWVIHPGVARPLPGRQGGDADALHALALRR